MPPLIWTGMTGSSQHFSRRTRSSAACTVSPAPPFSAGPCHALWFRATSDHRVLWICCGFSDRHHPRNKPRSRTLIPTKHGAEDPMGADGSLAPANELAKHGYRYPNESAEYRRARQKLLAEEIELRRH